MATSVGDCTVGRSRDLGHGRCFIRGGSLFNPEDRLDSRLERIFVVSGCKWISGLTCRISYNGEDVLPSRVFFTESDVEGKVLGAKVRLIYPKLRAGKGLGYVSSQVVESGLVRHNFYRGVYLDSKAHAERMLLAEASEKQTG